jgi:hypothetical protein
MNNGNSLWDNITNQFMAKPVTNSYKLGSTLYDAYNKNQQSKLMQQMAEKSDPFASQRAQYQQKLSQSYSDPMSIYNGAEFSGLNDLFSRQIAARDAAAGRNSQYGARATERQNYFNSYLDNYRKSLQTPAGANIAPNASGVQAMQYSNNNSNIAQCPTSEDIHCWLIYFPCLP